MVGPENDLTVGQVLRLVPGARLAHGIQLAADGRKLVPALLGLILMWTGWEALELAFRPQVPLMPRHTTYFYLTSESDLRQRPFETALGLILDPVRLPAVPIKAMFSIGGGVSRFVHASLAALWTLLVWGFFGGTIARLAVVEAATGQQVRLWDALRYALRKLVTLVASPLVVLGGVFLLGCLCIPFGLMYQAPSPWGATLAGVLAFVPLILGFVMSWLLAGFVAGWPLMVAATATENEDTFDALSRAFSYVFQRPMLYGFYAAVVLAFGMLGVCVIYVIAYMVLHLAAWGLAMGGPGNVVANYFLGRDLRTVPGLIHAGWVTCVAALAYSWAFSYFWTSAALVYLLMRHSVDGTDLSDVSVHSHSDSLAHVVPPSSSLSVPAATRQADEPGPSN